MIDIREILEKARDHYNDCCHSPVFLQVKDLHVLAHKLDVKVGPADTMDWLFSVPVVEDEGMPFNKWTLVTVAGEVLDEGTIGDD